MAFQAGSACFDTAEEANAFLASSQVGANLEHGGSVVVVDVAGVTATTITYSYTPLGGNASTQTFAATPQPCVLMSALDAVAIGWGIAAAVLGVYALMFLTRGFRDHGNA